MSETGQRSTSFVVSPHLTDAFVAGALDSSRDLLARARQQAVASKLGYAGDVIPREAWELVVAHAAVLVDVRTAEERQFVGRIERSVHVPWLVGASLQRNPNFVREMEGTVKRDDVLLLLCRSGVRSVVAAQVLTEAGFRSALNVMEGFEGALDEDHHRGHSDGWRFRQLPWVQD